MSKITYENACEVIAESGILMNKSNGKNPTASEVFNYSSTGELYMIPEWYKEAKHAIKNNITYDLGMEDI
tara:strand:+ start:459 stop:668 length:210 start_codon:yes stop_codon:yes gene_type:complete